ncbi:MAG: dihydrodipicolinate synthase family protein [Chloroflexi bacterium]|nr:dihydrodipicolinate synthase family protein [Chloroflexota bacterium]
MALNLSGVFPACVTPYDADGNASPKRFAANVARWEKAGLHGYLVLGSTGEFQYMDEAERGKLIEGARAAIPANKTMMVGAGHETTRMTIRYCKQAASLGADCVLVVTPVYYTRGKEDAQRKYYFDVADASPIPVLVYNVPGFTAYNISPEFVASVSGHPNIVGMKDSAGDAGQIFDTIRLTDPNFAVFTGNARILYQTLAVGGRGSILAAGNPLGHAYVGIYETFKRGDTASALAQQKEVRAAEQKLSAFGIAGWKYAMDVMGWEGGEPRLPILPLGDEAKAKIRAIMESLKLAA